MILEGRVMCFVFRDSSLLQIVQKFVLKYSLNYFHPESSSHIYSFCELMAQFPHRSDVELMLV